MKRWLTFTIALIFFSCHEEIDRSLSKGILALEDQGGVYQLECSVFDIPMRFIVDTGASFTTLSLTEAEFLLKHGLIKPSDVLEEMEVTLANGAIARAKRCIISNFRLGHISLSDVEVLLLQERTAPLLLGQSVLSKLEKVTINYNPPQLVIGDTTSVVAFSKVNAVCNRVREIELIKASNSSQAHQEKEVIEKLLTSCTSKLMVKNDVPRTAATDRIPSTTLRYFSAADNQIAQQLALLLQKEISKTVRVEDYSAKFKNQNNLQGHLEIWVK